MRRISTTGRWRTASRRSTRSSNDPSAPGSAGIWSRRAQAYAVGDVVPEHLAEVRAARLALIDKTEAAVKDRLTKEISYWDHRAAQLALEEGAGKPRQGGRQVPTGRRPERS